MMETGELHKIQEQLKVSKSRPGGHGPRPKLSFEGDQTYQQVPQSNQVASSHYGGVG